MWSAGHLVMERRYNFSMRKIKVIARANIISKTGEIHSDEGLRALDGYFEDTLSVEDNYDIKSLVDLYEEKYPKIQGWDFEIKVL